MARWSRRVVIAAALLALFPAAGMAGWKAVLNNSRLNPEMFLAVDKERQHLLVMEQKSPLIQADKLTCTTGKNDGDKLRAGDHRTPEGIYFVEARLDSGLDYKLYGSTAFPLNFPNPVDRLKGKTGAGIWIHGRGYPIGPNETRGCVALNDKDVLKLKTMLEKGVAVVIADEISGPGKGKTQAASKGELGEVEGRLRGWAKAWENKSEDFFGYYDQTSYASTSGKSFRAFADHKRRLFRELEWIQLVLTDVQALKGPDYWVTWFGQYYRTPFLASEGVKRLYWQRGADGELHIVGDEWDRHKVDLKNNYMVAMNKAAADFIESWRKAWERGDLGAYADFYAPDVIQDGREGIEAVREQKKALWSSSPPAGVAISGLVVRQDQKGLAVEFKQRYQNKAGYVDEGHKSLILRPKGDSWRIIQETWSAL